MENHISNIYIKSFRGIKDLDLDNLQPINILTGDNNCGKTSVLEVIQSFKNPDRIYDWSTITRRLNSGTRVGMSVYEGFYDLFDINEDEKKIEYGITLLDGEKHNIVLSAVELQEELSQREYDRILGLSTIENAEDICDSTQIVSKLDLKAEVDGDRESSYSVYDGQIRIPLQLMKTKNSRDIIYISPVRHAEGDVFLSRILEHPDLYEQMLLVLRDYDEDIISINYDTENSHTRRGVYKILSKSHKKALPLNVYGDGMKKAILLMSAVIAAKDGILLLDEFETAIHTSAMEKTFKWILETCIKMNVQVFLTSHSKEAIDKLLKCSPLCTDKMAVYTLYKDEEGSAVRRLDGRKAIKVQDKMGLELR